MNTYEITSDMVKTVMLGFRVCSRTWFTVGDVVSLGWLGVGVMVIPPFQLLLETVMLVADACIVVLKAFLEPIIEAASVVFDFIWNFPILKR